MTNQHNLEPKPRWILSVRDLPSERGSARYRVTRHGGETAEVILDKRKRQVVDALIAGELFCASTVRIGDIVFRLKEENSLHAETKALSNGRKYYTLQGKVQYLGPIQKEGAC
ncbi:hypothetical protein SAMN04488523_1258 [Sulfitobacter brevis]|uniref:Uncharacterized protein n=1 Tax=Sulfitobacter brevis TaxID=74348 RepID=A0A1I2GH18_9RHOB|nr:hypothetical protein [Sulfitobacter brevis]SFF17124.1 hypothetical protein SAMN04488523_1258 [Sulfitobacter brevis]